MGNNRTAAMLKPVPRTGGKVRDGEERSKRTRRENTPRCKFLPLLLLRVRIREPQARYLMTLAEGALIKIRFRWSRGGLRPLRPPGRKSVMPPGKRSYELCAILRCKDMAKKAVEACPSETPGKLHSKHQNLALMLFVMQ